MGSGADSQYPIAAQARTYILHHKVVCIVASSCGGGSWVWRISPTIWDNSGHEVPRFRWKCYHRKYSTDNGGSPSSSPDRSILSILWLLQKPIREISNCDYRNEKHCFICKKRRWSRKSAWELSEFETNVWNGRKTVFLTINWTESHHFCQRRRWVRSDSKSTSISA